MTLIEDRANRAAGNAAFTAKKATAFGASDIVITKRLCQFDDWTTHQIDERQRELADTAIAVWSIDY